MHIVWIFLVSFLKSHTHSFLNPSLDYHLYHCKQLPKPSQRPNPLPPKINLAFSPNCPHLFVQTTASLKPVSYPIKELSSNYFCMYDLNRYITKPPLTTFQCCPNLVPLLAKTNPTFFRNHPLQCSRLKSSMPFNHDLALQNIPLSKRPFKTKPQSEHEDVTWSPRYNLPTTRTNKRRALLLQEVELDGWFLILHIALETCTTLFMPMFYTSFVFHFYVLRLTSWLRTGSSTEKLNFESPSKWLLKRSIHPS